MRSRTSMRARAVVLAASVLGCIANGVALGQDQTGAMLPAKQIAAPASDIVTGVVRLPEPAATAETSTTSLIEINPEWADEDGVVSLGLPAGLGVGRPRVVFMPGEPGAWSGRVTMIDHDREMGEPIRSDDFVGRDGEQAVEAAGVSWFRQPLPWGGGGVLCDGLVLPAGHAQMWIEIELVNPVGGFVLIDQRPDRSLSTYVEQRRTVVGEPITLVSSLSDGSKIEQLAATVRSPGGERNAIEAAFDSDRVSFTPTEPGRYAVQVAAEYADAGNRSVVLTTQHVIEVEEPAALLGRARVDTRDQRIEIGFDADASGRRVILAAEVWGWADGEMVPVCWLSRVCGGDRSLSLDLRWVALAGVDPGSIELRQVRVHDVDSLVPLEIIERMAIEMPATAVPSAPVEVTADMIHGSAPMMVSAPAGFVPPAGSARGSLPGGHRLLLVHGYCSDGNPFTTSHFTGDIAIFDDPNVSRSQDAFALEMLSQTSPMKSFGVAGHSQGGMAAVHLYTFYFSGLDWARGDRLIQTVGAPWQGTPLAGNAAVLGDVFGFGCGENPDLSPTGAANWLSLIPTSSRQMVFYYTTAFEDRPFSFDFCNLVTDLLLSDPDDGVVERSRGQLPGGNNMGHIEGWCHTTDMRDPAQCTDASRNAIINARARR